MALASEVSVHSALLAAMALAPVGPSAPMGPSFPPHHGRRHQPPGQEADARIAAAEEKRERRRYRRLVEARHAKDCAFRIIYGDATCECGR